jgi:DNA-binding protein HU-beta
VNKAELIANMAEKSGLTKKDAEAALKGFIDSVQEALASGEKVQLVGFGTFESRERAARVGRNPRTKEEITIPASVVPVFKAGKEFKERVEKK